MAQVAVSVAVAGGGRGNVDESVEDVSGLPAEVAQQVYEKLPSGWVRATRTGKAQDLMRPRNDIADFLYAIVNFLGADSGLGKLLKRVADFFENLDPDGSKPWSDEDKLKIAFGLAMAEQANQPSAQAIGDWFGGECVQNLLTGVRDDVNEALIGLANKVPQRLQEFLGCTLQQNPQAQLAIPGLPQLDLSNIDVGKAIGCLISAAGVYQNTKNVWSALWSFGKCMLAGAGGGGGGAQVEHETASRC